MISRLTAAAAMMALGLTAPAFAQQPGSPPGVGGWTPPAPMAGPQGQMPPGMGGMSGMSGPMMGGPRMGGHYMGMGPGMQDGRMMGPGRWGNVTPEQREALISLRIANAKAALRLTPEQEKLWTPVETAIRESAAAMAERAKLREAQGRPTDPIAAMRMGAENMGARASMMSRMADAAAPLYATLTDEQKAQLPRVFRGMHRGGGKAMRMMREGWEGPEMRPDDWRMYHHRRGWNRD